MMTDWNSRTSALTSIAANISVIATSWLMLSIKKKADEPTTSTAASSASSKWSFSRWLRRASIVMVLWNLAYLGFLGWPLRESFPATHRDVAYFAFLSITTLILYHQIDGGGKGVGV